MTELSAVEAYIREGFNQTKPKRTAGVGMATMEAWKYLKGLRQKPENHQNVPLKLAEHYAYARASIASGNKALETITLVAAIAAYMAAKITLDTTTTSNKPALSLRFPLLGFLSNPPNIDLKQILSLGGGPVTKPSPEELEWQFRGIAHAISSPEIYIEWAE